MEKKDLNAASTLPSLLYLKEIKLTMKLYTRESVCNASANAIRADVNFFFFFN